MTNADFSSKEDLQWFFATPIVAHTWPESDELNADLRTVILNAEAAGNPKFGHLEGGWASDNDFFSWDADCVRTLSRRIQGLLSGVVEATTQNSPPRTDEWDLQSWANVMRNTGYHAPHTHPNSFWSGVYYVSVGDPEGDLKRNGCLELIDPRSAVGAIKMPGCNIRRELLIQPQDGLSIVFPGWLRHMVHSFRGEGERISISFNLDFSS